MFKRSVLESRKKTKSILRPKVRPTVKDHLQVDTVNVHVLLTYQNLFVFIFTLIFYTFLFFTLFYQEFYVYMIVLLLTYLTLFCLQFYTVFCYTFLSSQTPWPRSPTEKLLEEMFTGVSTQFLAVLETLSDHKGRALTRCPPRPVSDLDEDTVTDVFEELLCAGCDLVQSTLNQSEGLDCSTPLMQLAMQGIVHVYIHVYYVVTPTCYC